LFVLALHLGIPLFHSGGYLCQGQRWLCTFSKHCAYAHAHTDAHSYTNRSHADSHSNRSHADSHSDRCHADSHSDRCHADSHSDRCHADFRRYRGHRSHTQRSSISYTSSRQSQEKDFQLPDSTHFSWRGWHSHRHRGRSHSKESFQEEAPEPANGILPTAPRYVSSDAGITCYCGSGNTSFGSSASIKASDASFNSIKSLEYTPPAAERRVLGRTKN
jgi:hypothetical protein